MSTNIIAKRIELIECPRDAMQGILDFIPTDLKIKYIQQLLSVGFHSLDCGSFVSPKAIPQMRDTIEVINALDLSNSETKLSVIVANNRGASEASDVEKISYLGFPFSISEKFQQRNTKKSREDALFTLGDIKNIATKSNKQVVVYLSMGFGNPYEEPWDAELVALWVDKLISEGHRLFSVSDTVGVSNSSSIAKVFNILSQSFPSASFGAHFHTTSDAWQEKIEAAIQSGCTRFDGAIKGYGGCPMAKDDLVGNMPTEKMIDYFGISNLGLNKSALENAFFIADEVFLQYH